MNDCIQFALSVENGGLVVAHVSAHPRSQGSFIKRRSGYIRLIKTILNIKRRQTLPLGICRALAVLGKMYTICTVDKHSKITWKHANQLNLP